MEAINQGNVGIAKEILKKDFDPSFGRNYPLAIAINQNQAQIVEAMLQHPLIDPAARNNSAIRWASHLGHYKIVETLLKDSRVDPRLKFYCYCYY